MATVIQEIQYSYIKWATNAFTQALKDYERYEDYYNGEHPLEFATERWKTAFETIFEQFADNWCQVVVDAVGQRLEIVGWKSEDDDKDATAAEQIWDDNEMHIEADDVHTQTLVKGDGYIIAWPDPNTPAEDPLADDRGPVQMFYNDATEVNVIYDGANRRKIARAAKIWTDIDGERHLRIYLPDETQFYIVPSDDTRLLYQQGLLELPDVLPEGWTIEKPPLPNKFGIVPVFHFKNRALGSTHGTSEIKIVIPIQNAINKVLMDMMVTSEFSGFKQKYVAGSAHPPEGWRTGSDRVWATTDPQTKFGQFDESDLEQFTRVVEMLVGHVAKVTQTPMHYLRVSGDMPSGEALKTAESALVHKAMARQRAFGATWSKAMTFAVWAKTGSKPKSPLTPVWKDAETRHDLEQAQTAQLKSILGVPLRQLWQEHFDYTVEETVEFEKQNFAVAAAVLAQVIAQAGQLPPGVDQIVADPAALVKMLQGGSAPVTVPNGEGESAAGNGKTSLNLSQILNLLPKSTTAGTTAGESTVKPQPNTSPPASATRRSRGFKD